MVEFLLKLSLFPFVLTVLSYQIGVFINKKWKSPLTTPLLIAVLISIGVLLLTGYPADRYQATMNSSFQWLLTPATVCLAVPLYQQMKVLRKSLPGILTGVVAGTVTALGSVFGFCKLFHLSREVAVPMLTKSVTTAIGLALTEQNGGLVALAPVGTFITGMTGCVLGLMLCKLLKIRKAEAQGAAFGVSAHVIGTSKVSELGDLQAAVGTLSLTVSGVLTAVLFPILVNWL